MEAYYNDRRGRYGTGESYDWFYQYNADINELNLYTSPDGLWTYDIIESGYSSGIEILRYNGNETNIIVPSVIEGRNVISLNSTFDGFYELENIVIPEGITSVEGAFYGCEGLKNVTLPKSLTDMPYAFNCCYSLKEINIPDSVKDFSNAFPGTMLESFIFPQGTNDISSSFSDSMYLKKVVIPGSVEISYEAFADCEKLTEVTLENGITSIDDYAFFHCTSLKGLTIPGSVHTFGELSVGYMEIREYTDSNKTGFRIKGNCIIPGFYIKGVKGSPAEEYARDNGISFISL